MKDYIKCELIGGWSPRHLNTVSTCLVGVHNTHINMCYVLLLLLTVPMYTMTSTTENQNTPHLVATVDFIHVGSATASIEALVTLHRRTLQNIW